MPKNDNEQSRVRLVEITKSQVLADAITLGHKLVELLSHEDGGPLPAEAFALMESVMDLDRLDRRCETCHQRLTTKTR